MTSGSSLTKDEKNAGGEEAAALEESSLEAIVTSFLRRAALDGVRGRLSYLTSFSTTGGCNFQLPLNCEDYIARKLLCEVSEEAYRETFLWMVRSFVLGNRKIVKKMLKGEYKTRWD